MSSRPSTVPAHGRAIPCTSLLELRAASSRVARFFRVQFDLPVPRAKLYSAQLPPSIPLVSAGNFLGLRVGAFTISPWRNWIAQRTSIPQVLGSNPRGEATRKLGRVVMQQVANLYDLKGRVGSIPTVSANQIQRSA